MADANPAALVGRQCAVPQTASFAPMRLSRRKLYCLLLVGIVSLPVTTVLAMEEWEQEYQSRLDQSSAEIDTASKQYAAVVQEQSELESRALSRLMEAWKGGNSEELAAARQAVEEAQTEITERAKRQQEPDDVKQQRRETLQQLQAQKRRDRKEEELARKSLWCGTVSFEEAYHELAYHAESGRGDPQANRHPVVDSCEFLYEEQRECRESSTIICLRHGETKRQITPHYRYTMSKQSQYERDHELCCGQEHFGSVSPCQKREVGERLRRRPVPGNSGRSFEKRVEALEHQPHVPARYRLEFFKERETPESAPALVGKLAFRTTLPLDGHVEESESHWDACSGETQSKNSKNDYPSTKSVIWIEKAKVIGDRFVGEVVKQAKDERWERARKEHWRSEVESVCATSLREAPASYSRDRTERMAWDLRRMDGDCGGVVTRVKGDVTLDGKAVEAGGISLKAGSVLKTGRNSRLEIHLADGAVLRFGGRSEFTVKDPCFRIEIDPRTLGRLWQGRMYAIVARVVGEKTFEINTGTAVNGIRGHRQLDHPALETSRRLGWLDWMLPKIAAASEMPDESLDLSQEDLVKAAVILEIQRMPDQSLRITAHKGSVTVHSSHGFSATLGEGNTFSRPIVAEAESSEMAEYWVRIDVDSGEPLTSEDATSTKGESATQKGR